MRIDAGQADQVVVGGALDRRRRVLADVQAEDAAAAAKARLPHVGDERGQAVVVEAEPVDQRLRSGQAEHARLGLPGCASGVTVPTSTKPKPIAPKASMQRPFLSSPAARPIAIRKGQAGESAPGRARALRDQRDQRRVLDRRQRGEGEIVGVLGVEAEQERPRQRIGNERHGGGRFWHRRAYFDGEDPRMTEHRIEKDTFGDIAVPGRPPVGRADRALAASLRHLDREDAARADPRAGAGQAQRRGRQPRARHARPRKRPTRSSPPPTRCWPASTTASSRSRSGRPARARRPT